MAYAITDKPNTSAPDSDYPYGNIRDKEIGTPGTGVNKLVYADFHQFFAKLMDYAGVTPNGLPDNEFNGYQLMEALMELMGGVKTKILDIGVWNMNANSTIAIPHASLGVPLAQIVSIKAMITSDTNDKYQFEFGGVTANIDSTNINLERKSGGIFDNTSFDGTAFGRGVVIVQYIESL